MSIASQNNGTASDHGTNSLKPLFEKAKGLLEVGRPDLALAPLRDILDQHPHHPDALSFTGIAFGKLNMQDDAERFSRQAVAFRPDDAGLLFNLANRLRDRKRIDEALDVYDRALAADSDYVPALKSRLRCLVAEKRWAKARAAIDPLLAIITDDAELLAECAEVCIGADDRQKALALYEQAVALEPDRVPWLLQLARIAVVLDRTQLARTTGERVLELEESPEMRAMLASIMHRMSAFDLMAEHLAAIPDDSHQAANAANLRGMLLFSQCKTREGLDEMARTEDLAPTAFALQTTRAMYLNYDHELSTDALRDAHFSVGGRFAEALPLLDRSDLGQPHDPDRRLRIGFVSPDLRAHSVAYFSSPYFESFDRDHFDVYAYAYVAQEDGVSQAMQKQVTSWQNVFDLDDRALAERIRHDRIDILIDLAGFTRNSRLLAFTARPAPIQMTYIGYPNTVGLPAIDYRITDGIADPDGVDGDYSETLIRLPRCFLCYAIPNHAPPVEPGPVEHRGHITFGSFNNFAKINPDVIALWAEVLRAVPDSRLLCKSTSSADPEAQSVIRDGMARAKIDPNRISFSAFRKTPEGHLAVYNDVDIALDTFPYNGTTTTCEALWMGVPVVTLCGDRHAGRVGASLLHAIRFPAGIAESPEDYVLTARLLAENRKLLKTARHTLRQTVMHSPLCDSRDHAAALEQAFRVVWQMWCERQN